MYYASGSIPSEGMGLAIGTFIVVALIPFLGAFGIAMGRYTSMKTPLADLWQAIGWGVLFGLSFLIFDIIQLATDYSTKGILGWLPWIGFALYVVSIFLVARFQSSRRRLPPPPPSPMYPPAPQAQMLIEKALAPPPFRTWSTALAFAATNTATMATIAIGHSFYESYLAPDADRMNELGFIFGPPMIWMIFFPISLITFAVGLISGRSKNQ